MKTIYRIARFELSTMFYSPIAWLVLIIFMLQTSLIYTDTFVMIERYLKLNFNIGGGMTFQVFNHPNYGMFRDVFQNTYLYIPLLTMGLISKEISSGSIKLLMSSPLNARQLVIGKYLAMIGYCLILALVLLILMLAGGLSIEHADFGLVLSAIFAFFLLAASYSAIGLFISSLTSYQVVAAIGTLATLAGLNYVDKIGQSVPIISDLTYWLSISGRTNEMAIGLINTRDIVYFLIIITLFLAFAVSKISGGRIVGHWWIKARAYILVFAIAILLGYISSRPRLVGYWDTTATKMNTLTPPSQDVVRNMRDDLKIVNYVNILDMSSFSATPRNQKRDFKRFDNYLRYLPQWEMEYVYFWDTITLGSYMIQNNPELSLEAIARKTADNWEYKFEELLTPSQIKQKIDLSTEDNQFVRVVNYNGKQSFLRMFDDIQRYPAEAETSAALKRLTGKTPKVYFVTGHGERDYEKSMDKDYQMAMTLRTFRHAMIQKGFDFERVNLESQNIPGDASLLVIASPTTPYTETELGKINDYIAKGGNLLLAIEPETKDYVLSIINQFGISVVNGQLNQNNDGFEKSFILADFTNEAKSISDNVEEYIEKSKKVSMPDVIAFSHTTASGFEIKPYLFVKAKDTKLVTENGENNFSAPVAYNITKKVGGKEQRIMVFGDADFMSNAEYQRNIDRRNVNAEIVGQIFSWFTYGEFPLNTSKPKNPDTKTTITKTGKLISKTVLVGVIPGIIFALGSIVLLRRRKK